MWHIAWGFSPEIFSARLFKVIHNIFMAKFMNTFTLKYFIVYICKYFLLCDAEGVKQCKSWDIVSRRFNWIKLPLLRTLHCVFQRRYEEMICFSSYHFEVHFNYILTNNHIYTEVCNWQKKTSIFFYLIRMFTCSLETSFEKT